MLARGEGGDRKGGGERVAVIKIIFFYLIEIMLLMGDQPQDEK